METTTELTTGASEESTYVIRSRFYDEDDVPVIPETVTWTLTDANGAVINSRENILVTAAQDVSVVLSGDDLAMQTGETGHTTVWRYFAIKATYNSVYGVGLPIKEQCKFHLTNLRGV